MVVVVDGSSSSGTSTTITTILTSATPAHLCRVDTVTVCASDGSDKGLEVPAQVTLDGGDYEREWGRGMLRVDVVVSVDRAGVARLRVAVGTSKASLSSCEGTAARAARAARAEAGETTAPLVGDRQGQGLR